jgi:adenosylhomocysteine nucleosidase
VPTVVVLAPMRTELTPVVKRLQLRRARRREGAIDTWTGRVGDHDVVAAMAGVGTRRSAEVARSMIDRFGPDHVVVAGVAGGLADHLVVGDLVIPATVHDMDRGTSHAAHPLGHHVPEGELITSNEMHGWDELEEHSRKGILAVDMETAAIAAVCDEASVPWTAIRALSDVVRDGTVDGATLAFLNEDGSTNAAAVARHLARHPGSATDLASMGRDTAKATANVARAVEAGLSHERVSR